MELGRDRTVREIISRLKIARGGGVVKVEGTWGSFAPLLAAYISKELGRPILYIRPHIDDADKAADDLHTFGAEQVEALPAWEGEEELADATDEIRAERLKLVSRLSSLVARDREDKHDLLLRRLCRRFASRYQSRRHWRKVVFNYKQTRRCRLNK